MKSHKKPQNLIYADWVYTTFHTFKRRQQLQKNIDWIVSCFSRARSAICARTITSKDGEKKWGLLQDHGLVFDFRIRSTNRNTRSNAYTRTTKLRMYTGTH